MLRKPTQSTGAQALFQDAVRLHREGRIPAAIELYRRVISITPDSADAHSNLGAAFFAQGTVAPAVEHCERALALNPRHAGAHNNLAAALAALGQTDEAVAHYQRVLMIDPGNADAHKDLAGVFQVQGKFDEALSHYARAIAIRPDFAEAHLGRAHLKTFAPGDSELAALELLAVGNSMPPYRAACLHFALGKAHEDCGDYERSFKHLRQANQLKRSQIHYDEPTLARLFERIQRVFEASLFDRGAGRLRSGGDPSDVPVFVVGMPRSGSTLVEQILSSHPQIHGAGELEDLEQITNRVSNSRGQLLSYPEYVPELTDIHLQRIGAAYLERLPSLLPDKTRVVDKLPINFINIGLIRLVLPNAKIIHTVRAPLDNCLSCYTNLFTSGQEFSYDLAELGRHYSRYAHLMAHWRRVLPPESMLEVAYEDVVNDLEGQARRMIAYCGLPWNESCLSFHRSPRPVKTASAAQVRKPLYDSSVGRWRKYESYLEPLIRELGDLAHAVRAHSASE